MTRYVEHVGPTPDSAVCIGTVTSAEAQDAGFDVAVAATPTTDAIVAALLETAP